ncbi:MAG: DUF4856 domain-containing protein [Bacteroidetes bacterium]|nr:MAG: DUF4856 domain-containing protein [Bacteroidota bacterium]MBL1143741.1 DUF4856 domain-containing protein [Bacteroidota bacterium]NOG56543.1 DUF4856 domain-containing protein [Bacteroidota bacterium]
MKKATFKILTLICFATAVSLTACTKDDDTNPSSSNNDGGGSQITPPATYSFSRLGFSTVNYDGQTSRLQQLDELVEEIVKGGNGTVLSEQKLQDMFSNTGNPFSQVYSKDLKSKTFALDTTYFKSILTAAAAASVSPPTASNGVAGILTRTNGKKMLVDENGREFKELIEKGLMGATFYNQIVNNYLTSSKIGSAVDNETIDSANGKYYTTMEHHFDEAFGYMGFPTDFSSNYSGTNSTQFWGKYCNVADDDIQLNDKLMNAFKLGRAAIVAKNYRVLDQQVQIIYEQLEVLIAASAIHYINQVLSYTNTGDIHHSLSECYGFIRSLRYSNALNRKLTASEVDDLLQNRIGDNFYNTTKPNLNYIKTTLSTTYGLDSVKDNL